MFAIVHDCMRPERPVNEELDDDLWEYIKWAWGPDPSYRPAMEDIVLLRPSILHLDSDQSKLEPSGHPWRCTYRLYHEGQSFLCRKVELNEFAEWSNVKVRIW